MSSHEVKLYDLFEKATSTDLKESDYGLNLEITDKMNSRRRYTLEGILYFKQLFESTELKSIQLTLSLFETCVKNCNSQFHRLLSSHDFVPTFLKLLKRRRKKLSLVEKMAGLYKNSGWRAIEDRVLSLFQLWADTFMMQEDKYPAFMKAYRELRKEGVKFPTRDPNERFMIKFEGEPSPAFELADMEQPNRDITVGPTRPPEIRRVNEVEEPKLFKSDIEQIKINFPYLEELILTATSVFDLQVPRARDIIRNCRSAQKKLIIFMSYKIENSTDERNTIELIEIIDHINTKMQSFKNAVSVLKRNGTNHEIRAALGIKENEDMNMLEDDFLEIHENPLDKLERYIGSLQVAQDMKIQEPVMQEPEIQVYVEPVQRLAPDIDLLISDPDPPSQPTQNIFDLNEIFSSPAPNYNQNYAQDPNYPHQNYPQNVLPPNYTQYVQPVDEYEDFFSDLANRR